MILALGREIEKQNVYRIWKPGDSVRAIGALLSRNHGSPSTKVGSPILYTKVIM